MRKRLGWSSTFVRFSVHVVRRPNASPGVKNFDTPKRSPIIQERQPLFTPCTLKKIITHSVSLLSPLKIRLKIKPFFPSLRGRQKPSQSAVTSVTRQQGLPSDYPCPSTPTPRRDDSFSCLSWSRFAIHNLSWASAYHINRYMGRDYLDVEQG